MRLFIAMVRIYLNKMHNHYMRCAVFLVICSIKNYYIFSSNSNHINKLISIYDMYINL